MTEFSRPVAYFADVPVALVVGCGDMGMGCARILGKRQPLVMVDIDGARLAQCTETLQAEGYSVSGRQCDITSSEQVAAFVE